MIRRRPRMTQLPTTQGSDASDAAGISYERVSEGLYSCGSAARGWICTAENDHTMVIVRTPSPQPARGTSATRQRRIVPYSDHMG